jgi:hypothetical protein
VGFELTIPASERAKTEHASDLSATMTGTFTFKVSKIIREMCNDIERENIFSNTIEKISLMFYCEVEHEWGEESYADECTREERMAEVGKGYDRERKEENAKNILLKCPKTKKWREKFVCSK